MPVNKHGFPIFRDTDSFPKVGQALTKEQRALDDAKYFIKNRSYPSALLALGAFGTETSDLDARLLYGMVARGTEQLSEAITHFNYVRENATNDKFLLEGIFGIAVTKKLDGDLAGAFEHAKACETLVAAVPDRRHAVNYFLADLHYISGNYIEANRYIKLAKETFHRSKPDLRLQKLDSKIKQKLATRGAAT